MSVSGPEALRSLEEALRDVRREEDDIAKRLAKSAELVSKFRETEGELMRRLAEIRLDPQTRAELAGRLSAAELKAREMLDRHSGDLAKAEATLAAHDREIAALTLERADLTGKAEKAQAELKGIADKVMAEAGSELAEARAAAEAQAQVAAESLEKTRQAETDREEKGRPYRDDPLFMYLWEAGFGTKTYRANNLIRWLDGLIAGMVRFPEARANFARLNEIPLRLREHAEQQQRNAEAAADGLVALQMAAIDAAGGKATRQALEQAQARIAAIDAAVVALEDKRDEATKQQRDLAQGNDPAFSAAAAALAEALGREDIKTLLAEARATQTGADDTIVKQVDEVRQRAAEEDADARDLKARLKTLASRRRELEDIQYEFKRKSFDSPSSTFGNDKLIGDMLNEFLRGGISAAEYWGRWQQSQNWARGTGPSANQSGGFSWPDSSFAGGSTSKRSSSGGNWGKLPGPPGGGFGGGLGGGLGGGGSSGGGGFSRPRTGSRGNRPGGGFKTGGGF